MPYSIVIVPRAQNQIAAARDWWQLNRPEAPTRLRDELDRALGRLVENPNVGTPWPRRADVRRLLLGRIEFHLLHRVRLRAQRVEVLALWHGRRGTVLPGCDGGPRAAPGYRVSTTTRSSTLRTWPPRRGDTGRFQWTWPQTTSGMSWPARAASITGLPR